MKAHDMGGPYWKWAIFDFKHFYNMLLIWN